MKLKRPNDSDEKIFKELTTQPKNKRNTPAEKLLTEGKFEYIRSETTGQRATSYYHCIKTCVLKCKETWEVFEELLDKYQKGELPHPSVDKVINELREEFEDKPQKVDADNVRRKLAKNK